jgi:hypothetical protein
MERKRTLLKRKVMRIKAKRKRKNAEVGTPQPKPSLSSLV